MKECSRSISIQNCGSANLDAAMFFGEIDLYSDHWVTSHILVLAGLLGTIVASRARQVAICFVYSMDAMQIYPTQKYGGAQI